MKKTILFIIALVPTALFAQVTAERQVIGSAGWDASTATLQASSTVGETMIATGTSATLILTQGFQQANIDSSVGIEETKFGFTVNAYPNPTADAVVLDFNADKASEIQVSVFDINGKSILPINTIGINGSSKHVVNLAPFAAGNYIIRLTNKEGTLNTPIKIQKVN